MLSGATMFYKRRATHGHRFLVRVGSGFLVKPGDGKLLGSSGGRKLSPAFFIKQIEVMDLENKTAIVTGATSGIGFASAKALHKAGVNLVVTGRTAERVNTMSQEFEGVASLVGDIREPDLPQRLIDLALEQYGSCDIVFNNAGVIHNGPMDKINIDAVCEMVQINVEAAFRMAYTAVKHFDSVNCGHLINTSSVLGIKTRIYTGAYAGTKHAIEALSEALRIELSRRPIQVTCIQPGLVMTDLHRDYPLHPKETMKIDKPLTPDDVADAVMYALTRPDHVTIPSCWYCRKIIRVDSAGAKTKTHRNKKMTDSTQWGIENDYGMLTDVLLGKPDYYRWTDAGPLTRRTFTNAHKTGVQFDFQLAQDQHAEMVSIYESAGVETHFLPSDEVLHRNFFARDSSAMTPWGPLVCHMQLKNPARGLCERDRVLQRHECSHLEIRYGGALRGR